jgi:hypothetical protein
MDDKLFGFEIKRKKNAEDLKNRVSFVPPHEDEGTDRVVSVGGHYGYYVDIDGSNFKDEKDLILKYRDVAQHPECDSAIEDIVNEAIVSDDNSSPVNLVLEDLDQPDRIKKLITEEFERVVELLDFNWRGHEIFRKWYIDGRLFYHKIVDDKNLKAGVQEVRLVDPLKIRKVREVEEKVDEKTGVKIISKIDEYFVYKNMDILDAIQDVRISKDAVTYVTSGVVDPSQKRVYSYLHKAIKPVNQLRMMEDSLVIYRLSRAPERRIFYIDVGNLPKGKAEEYMRSIMSKYKNKMVYDADTGEMRDERKHMSMLEDFWLPRREGGRGTEITTLPGGQNLSQIDDIIYFQKKLYKSLNVPLNRLEQESQFSLGRSSEISRDEIKFQKFINRLRKRFSVLFIDILKTQCILKGIVTEEEWVEFSQNMSVDYIQDTHFSELKESELLSDRLRILMDVDSHVGKYFSKEWVQKNVLRLTDEDIEKMDKEMKKEDSSGELDHFPIHAEDEIGEPQKPYEPSEPYKGPEPTKPKPKKEPSKETNEDIGYSETEQKLIESITKFIDNA